MLEVLKMQANQQRALLSSLENGQPLSVLKMQQMEFEKLRKEHTVRLTLPSLLPSLTTRTPAPPLSSSDCLP
jgi:hypothetical protein